MILLINDNEGLKSGTTLCACISLGKYLNHRANASALHNFSNIEEQSRYLFFFPRKRDEKTGKRNMHVR